MGARSRLLIAISVLLVAGCSNSSGGSGGRLASGSLGNVPPAPSAPVLHLVASVQPSSPSVGDPVAVTVEVRDDKNNLAPVTSDLTFYVRGASLGFEPRVVESRIAKGASSATVSGRIAAVGSYTIAVYASGLSATQSVTVRDAAIAGTNGSEVNVDAGGPGLDGYGFADLAALDSQAACAFCDGRIAGASHVFVNASNDAGATWNGPVRADHGSADAWDASLAVDGHGLAIASWCDRRAVERGAVYATVSHDGGITFVGSDVRVDAAAARVAPCTGTRAAVASGRIFVAWVDARDAAVGASVYVARSLDQAKTFAESRVDAHSAGKTPWSIEGPLGLVASGDDVAVLWIERQGASANLVVAASEDGGATFSRTTLVTAPNNPEAQLVSSGGAFFAAWQDDRASAVTAVSVRRSLDGGASWGAEAAVPLGATKSQVRSFTLSASGPQVVVIAAAQDQGSSQLAAFAATSSDGGATFAAGGKLGDGVRSPGAGSLGLAVCLGWNEVAYANGERSALSADGGATFAAPAKVSGQATDGLFGPARSVAASSGRFYALWEEARGAPSSPSHLYLVVTR